MTKAKAAAKAQTKPLTVTEAAAPLAGALALVLALPLAFGTPSVGRMDLASSPSVLCFLLLITLIFSLIQHSEMKSTK